MEGFIETVRLASGVYVQASSQKFRLYRASLGFAPCIDALQETGDISVTRQILAGAFYAGIPQRSSNEKIIADSLTGTAPSLLRHIHSLAFLYHMTHATPPTMRRVAERMAARGRHAAAEHCRLIAREESGHDTLALTDLAALGLPAKEFVARVHPQNAVTLVELFTRFADSDAPIAVLGYGYALERLALFFSEESIAAIERLIPSGINATRCLRVHSAVGSDARHVLEMIAFIATLPPEDRAATVRATYETIRVHWATPSDYPGDAAMRAQLDEFGYSMTGAALA